MRILITNDDGIHAPGLAALKRSLEALGEVVAVAPERPRSASGHAITLHKPLRLREVRMADGSVGYASNGTPADCVALGTSEHLGGRPDLVVSGINLGPNLGIDVIYSGTVAAAMEGAICGLPSFAVSLAAREQCDFGPAAEFAAVLAAEILRRGLPPGCFLNVNVPALPKDRLRGVAITRQGPLRYQNRMERRTDPMGEHYYWFTGERIGHGDGPGTDAYAISHQLISITPIRIDLTSEPALAELEGWSLSWPSESP